MGFLNNNYKEVYKLFLVWQDEQEERWLRKMSLEGWHFVGVSSIVKYKFIKGEPLDYHYKLDFKNNNQNEDEYLSIFKNSDWEYIGNMLFWRYFRKLSIDGQVPEIYTDNQSKVDRNKRIIRSIFPVLALNLFAGIMNFNNYLSGGYKSSLSISTLSVSCTALLAYAIYKIKEKNKTLDEEI